MDWSRQVIPTHQARSVQYVSALRATYLGANHIAKGKMSFNNVEEKKKSSAFAFIVVALHSTQEVLGCDINLRTLNCEANMLNTIAFEKWPQSNEHKY